MECAALSLVLGFVGIALARLLEAFGVPSTISYPLAICIFLGAVYKFTSDRYFIQRWRRRLGF